MRGRPSENTGRGVARLRRAKFAALAAVTAATVLAVLPHSTVARTGNPCVNNCGTLTARPSDPKPCANVCRAVIKSTPDTKRWASPQLLHADLKVTVKVGHRVMRPTYYRRHGELCIGYYAGYGTTTKVDVCGRRYRLRVTTQAFHGHQPVIVRYRAYYSH